jgi:hypothetical protein
LVIKKEINRGQRAIMAYMIAGVITVLTATLLPSVPVIDHYHIDKNEFSKQYVCGGNANAGPAIEGLRNHTIHTVFWPSQAGLTTFPSFHATFAILFIYVSFPLRYLRLPVLLVCIGTLLSAPVCI